MLTGQCAVRIEGLDEFSTLMARKDLCVHWFVLYYSEMLREGKLEAKTERGETRYGGLDFGCARQEDGHAFISSHRDRYLTKTLFVCLLAYPHPFICADIIFRDDKRRVDSAVGRKWDGRPQNGRSLRKDGTKHWQ